MSSVYVYTAEPRTKAVKTRTLSEEPMVNLDYDVDGVLIGVEVLDATGVSVDSTLDFYDREGRASAEQAGEKR